MTEIPETGKCFECGVDCTKDNDYCYGCKTFICSKCEKSGVMGFDHDPEEHLQEDPFV